MAGRTFLDWKQFTLALAVYDRIAALVAEQKLAGVEYQGRMLLEDAHAARCRLPVCAGLLRDGRIDPRRFHKMVLAIELVTDPFKLVIIDQLIAAKILTLAQDPDAARRCRDAARKRRGVRTRTLDDGLAELTVVASAEDIRLAAKSIDAAIEGLCEHDPRTKDEQRSAAAIARHTGKTFGCLCERDDCTARVDVASIDERCARIIVHAVCDSATLDGSDVPGNLDGHGPISGDHVRELAGSGIDNDPAPAPSTSARAMTSARIRIWPISPAGTPMSTTTRRVSSRSSPSGRPTAPPNKPARIRSESFSFGGSSAWLPWPSIPQHHVKRSNRSRQHVKLIENT